MSSVLISGCSDRGIGYYTALAFAEAGYKVYATVRGNSNQSDAKALAAREDCDVELVELDVTNEEQVAEVRDYVLSRGGIDVLINNAGVTIVCPFGETKMEAIRTAFEVNVFGTMNMIHAFLPSMQEKNAGTIVNLSSLSSLLPSGVWAAYGASKAAVDLLTLHLRKEIEEWDIRLLLLYPGSFRTAVLENSPAATVELEKNSPYYDFYKNFFDATRARHRRVRDSEQKRERETTKMAGEEILKAVENDNGEVSVGIGRDAVNFVAKYARPSDVKIF